jgi:uncharacterized membrane protein
LAATVNVVPATLFEFRGRHNFIRAQQVATAVLLRAINIVRSDLMAFGR